MKPYKISSPIMNKTVTPDTRDEYLKQIRLAKIDRVFLTTSDFGCTSDQLSAIVNSLRENIDFFNKNGIEAAIWVGTTVGHGVPLTGAECQTPKAPFSPLVNLAGEVVFDTRCPLDPNFQDALAKHIAALATTGTKIILLDDDFRLSQHGKEFCCACERHMNAIREYCGEAITREELREYAFSQKANKFRRAWLKAQGDSLRNLATVLRKAVDAVDPSVTLALCSSHSVWDIDGTSPLELGKILAGKNKPLVRLHGAPYWATHSDKPLPVVFETARMFSAYSQNSGAELMAEGDVYPRPRYFTPSSHLELFDAVIRADGTYNGILKYMFDYVSDPYYETGYIKRHCHMLNLQTELQKLFENKAPCGISVPQHPRLLENADLSFEVASQTSPYPLAGLFLALNSIPTVYTNEGICTAVFGEEARHISLDQLKKGAVLDAVSAILLTERGVDVGLKQALAFETGCVSTLRSAKTGEHAAVWKGNCRMLKAEIKEKAFPVENAVFNGNTISFAYRYENQEGQRFLVYLFDALAFPRNPNVLRGYLGQRILSNGLEWIAQQKLPARSEGNPDLYLMCAKGMNGQTLAVGMFNCYADSILEPVVKLDRAYNSIRFVNCNGTLCGDTVTLDRPLGAFEFCAFEVSL